MSDFLTRLAQRAQGEAASITPRLPSRYAPLRDGGFELHQTAAASPAGASSSSKRLDDDAEPERAARSTLPGDETHRQSPETSSFSAIEATHRSRRVESSQHHNGTAAHQPFANAATEEETRSTPETSLLITGTREPQESFAVPHAPRPLKQQAAQDASGENEYLQIDGASNASAAQETHGPITADAGLKVRGSEQWQTLLPSTKPQEASRDRFAEAMQSATGPAAPSIHISIGRVEVRANIGKTTVNTPPPRAASKPALSLDDYLKRGGGKA